MRALATAAISSVVIRVFPASSLQAKFLTQAAVFCAACLSVWLLSMTYGLDLSLAFF
jgi:hypothetical protein